MGSSPRKEELWWRHWGLAAVCLAFCCLNAVCFVYASSVPASRLLRAAELHHSKEAANPLLPWKEYFYFLAIIPLSIFFDGAIVVGLVFATLSSKAEKDNLKELKEIVGFGAYDRQYTGTEVYKEVALDFTRRSFAFCVFIYGVAFPLEACFNIFEQLRLTSIALIILFSVLLTILFGVSFFMHIKIALRLGVDKQEVD